MIVIMKFIPRNAFSSYLVTVKFLPFLWAQRFDCSIINFSSSLRLVTKENICIGEPFSSRLHCISGTRWRSYCLVTFTFLAHFHNSSFLFFSFFFGWLSLGTTWRLDSGVVKEVSCVLAACAFSASPMNSSLNCLCHSLHHLVKHIFINCEYFRQYLSSVTRHLASKNCLILFREQNIFRKKPLHLLTLDQLQLAFGMKNL